MESQIESGATEAAKGFAAACRKLGIVPYFAMETAKSVGSFYEQFEVQKRRGGGRKISASNGRLKRLQRQILKHLLSKHILPPHVHGCVKGRSIVTNAAAHVKQEVVVNLDLRNFFNSINTDKVKAVFLNVFKLDTECAEVFTTLCTYEGVLPQGAPTSPALANFASLELDAKILEVLGTTYNYSRYVDDITISGAKEIVEVLPQIYKLIEDSGFEVNQEKTRILRRSVRQSVTGIVVNEKVSATKQFIRKTRQHLYFCKKFGVDAHCDWINQTESEFLRAMNGRIGFIRISQPALADSFSAQLREIFPLVGMSEEMRNLSLLKSAVDNERMVAFIYEDTHRQVAPTEIYVDDDEDIIFVKGFQFSPDPGWFDYSLASITELTVIKNSVLNG